jgi:cysteine-rich repeat protein
MVLVAERRVVLESWEVRRRAAIFFVWLASACVDAQPGPPLHDDGTATDPGTTDPTAGTVATSTPDDGTGSTTDDTGPLDPVCGDGLVEAPEECDLAELNGTGTYCKDDCRANACGDGYLGPGETCDDGNRSNADACTKECGPPSCGDGIVQGREQCDDWFDNAKDAACLPSCTLATCGDGFIQWGVEACDTDDVSGYTCVDWGYPGGALGCTDDCLSFDVSGCEFCGNGELERGEECDGTDLGGQTCASLLGEEYVGIVECQGSCLFDASNCCLDTGDACRIDADCCSGWCTVGNVCHEPV